MHRRMSAVAGLLPAMRRIRSDLHARAFSRRFSILQSAAAGQRRSKSVHPRVPASSLFQPRSSERQTPRSSERQNPRSSERQKPRSSERQKPRSSERQTHRPHRSEPCFRPRLRNQRKQSRLRKSSRHRVPDRHRHSRMPQRGRRSAHLRRCLRMQKSRTGFPTEALKLTVRESLQDAAASRSRTSYRVRPSRWRPKSRACSRGPRRRIVRRNNNGSSRSRAGAGVATRFQSLRA